MAGIVDGLIACGILFTLGIIIYIIIPNRMMLEETTQEEIARSYNETKILP